MSSTATRLTYQEYLELPETHQRYEIIDGVLQYMSPAPTIDHQRFIARFFKAIDPFVEKNDLGEVLISPCDILSSRQPMRTRQPDLMFVAKARRDILKEQVEGAPDVVVEILSLGNTERQIEKKLADYAALGVKECWLLRRPPKRWLEVLRLEKGAYRSAGICSPGQPVPSRILAGFVLPTGLFDE